MYIDPNTGGMLFQVLAVLFGLVSGAVLFLSSRFRMTVGQFRRFMRSRRNKKEEEPLSYDQPVE